MLHSTGHGTIPTTVELKQHHKSMCIAKIYEGSMRENFKRHNTASLSTTWGQSVKVLVYYSAHSSTIGSFSKASLTIHKCYPSYCFSFNLSPNYNPAGIQTGKLDSDRWEQQEHSHCCNMSLCCFLIPSLNKKATVENKMLMNFQFKSSQY